MTGMDITRMKTATIRWAIILLLIGLSVLIGPARAQPARHIVFLGDSLTAGGNWHRYFPGSWIKNAGVVGDKTGDILDRLDAVIALNPDEVYLLAGINDLASGVHPDRIVAHHKRIMKRLLTASPDLRLYVQSILPVNTDKLGGGAARLDNRDIMALNKRIRAAADTFGAVYIDVFDALGTADHQLHPDHTRDGVHLNHDAYQIWRSVLEPYMNR